MTPNQARRFNKYLSIYREVYPVGRTITEHLTYEQLCKKYNIRSRSRVAAIVALMQRYTVMMFDEYMDRMRLDIAIKIVMKTKNYNVLFKGRDVMAVESC